MFSKKGFEDYFGDLLAVERGMASVARETANLVQDSEVRARLLAIQADEERHIAMVEGIRSLFAD